MYKWRMKLDHIKYHLNSIVRNPKGIWFYIKGIIRTIFMVLVVSIIYINSIQAKDNRWTITAYCPCARCCGTCGGYQFASGMPVCKEIDSTGYLYGACNILPFGTIVDIDKIGKVIIVDRGSKKYFDNQTHIDIFMWSHEEAIKFGKQLHNVNIQRR